MGRHARGKVSCGSASGAEAGALFAISFWFGRGLLAAIACSSLAFARQTDPTASDPNAPRTERSAPTPLDGTALNGQVDLQRLVDLSAARLGLDIEYDASILAGNVTLRLGDPLSDEELWALTNHALASRGFTTVAGPTPNLISVVKAERATTLGRVEDLSKVGPGSLADPDAPSGAAFLPGFLTVATRLVHVSPKDAIESLKPIVKGDAASVTALGATNLLLITDVRPRVEQALEILKLLDVPGPESVVAVVPVENLSAASIVTSAMEVHNARETIGGRTVRGKLLPLPDGFGVVLVAPKDEATRLEELVLDIDAREGVRTETYAPRYFAVDEVASLLTQVMGDPKTPGAGGRYRVVTDPLTSTLVVTGTSAQHEKVRSLLERLDSVPPQSRKQVRTFGIRNRPVTEIVELLEKLITVDVFEVGSPPSSGATSDAASTAQRTIRDFGPPQPTLSTGSGETSGASTGSGGAASSQDSPSTVSTADDFARDSRRASGSSASETDEALREPPISLAADSATNTLLAIGEPRLLTQLDQLVRRLDVRQPQVMLEVMVLTLTDSESEDLGIELQGEESRNGFDISLSSLFGLASTDGGASGGDSGLLGGSGATALVLRPGEYGVLLRALASVNAGKTRNLPKVLVNNNEEASFDAVLQQPFLSTNASDTIATTSFGGTQDAGTSVKVKPQIGEGDHLLLDYTISLSSFIGESTSPALPPPRQQNTLSSVVSIPDGSTVVLGGLEVLTDADASTRVPWLADFPLLGFLFENRSTSRSRSRFFLFIRGEVLRHGRYEDLKYISAKDRAAADLQVEDRPVVRPRVIR